MAAVGLPPAAPQGRPSLRLIGVAAVTAAILLAGCSAIVDDPSAGQSSTVSTSEPSSTVSTSEPSPTVSTGEAASVPSPRGYHGMVDLPGAPGVLMVGGARGPGATGLQETWTYAPADGWQLVTDSAGPSFGDALDNAASTGKVVQLDGYDTRQFDPATGAWTSEKPEVRPAAANGPRMAYDSESDRLIVFGGLVGRTMVDTTWAYDPVAGSWTEMHPVVKPPARNFGTMAYDPGTDRVILFGGGTFSSTFGDTWAYDFNADAWEELVPATAPTARSYAAMVYDPIGARLILFGGVDELRSEVSRETWAYDPAANAWSDLTPGRAPPARGWHAMAFDVETGTIILFGGGPSRESYTAETWIYDPAANVWSMAANPG